MLRKTIFQPSIRGALSGASMRPQRNAAENHTMINARPINGGGFNEAAA